MVKNTPSATMIRSFSEPNLSSVAFARVTRAVSDSALVQDGEDHAGLRELKALAQEAILQKKDDALWDRSQREVTIAQGALTVFLVVGLYLGHVALSTVIPVCVGYVMVSAPLNPFLGWGLYKIRLCFEKKPRKIQE